MQVSLRFPSLQQLPAEKTTLSLQAQPGSLCSLRAIDQSVLLLHSEQELTVDYVRIKVDGGRISPCSLEHGFIRTASDADMCVFAQVYGQLPLQKLSGYNYEVEDFEPYPCFPLPVPSAELEPEPEPEPEPEIEDILVEVDPAARAKRSMYFGPPNQKNDVYSIFKVEKRFG